MSGSLQVAGQPSILSRRRRISPLLLTISDSSQLLEVSPAPSGCRPTSSQVFTLLPPSPLSISSASTTCSSPTDSLSSVGQDDQECHIQIVSISPSSPFFRPHPLHDKISTSRPLDLIFACDALDEDFEQPKSAAEVFHQELEKIMPLDQMFRLDTNCVADVELPESPGSAVSAVRLSSFKHLDAAPMPIADKLRGRSPSPDVPVDFVAAQMSYDDDTDSSSSDSELVSEIDVRSRFGLEISPIKQDVADPSEVEEIVSVRSNRRQDIIHAFSCPF